MRSAENADKQRPGFDSRHSAAIQHILLDIDNEEDDDHEQEHKDDTEDDTGRG